MAIHRTHPYPAYGGPGAVTGDVAGRQGRREHPDPTVWDQIRKGVKRYGEVKSVYLGKFKRPPQCYCIPADREPRN